MFCDDLHFEDGWHRYVATKRSCDDVHTRLSRWDALQVLLQAVRDAQLDPAQLGADPSDLAWTLEIAMERGLTVQRRLSRSEQRAEAEVIFVHAGTLEVRWADGALMLGAGDTLSVPAHLSHSFRNTASVEMMAFVVRGGDAPAMPVFESRPLAA